MNNIIKKFTGLMGVILFFVFYLSIPGWVYAGVPVVEVGSNLAKNTVSANKNTITALKNTKYWEKEEERDLEVTDLMRTNDLMRNYLYLKEHLGAMGDYPNLDVEGSVLPGNITLLKADLAKEAASVFLEEGFADTEACTDDWKERIGGHIESNYFLAPPFSSKAECTVKGVDGFVEDFYEGGWDTWIKMGTESQNNPYGFYLYSLEEAESRISARQRSEMMELEMGNGALSSKECIKKSSFFCEEWKTVLPGNVIADQVNKYYGEFFKEAGEGDEISELAAVQYTEYLGFIWDSAINYSDPYISR